MITIPPEWTTEPLDPNKWYELRVFFRPTDPTMIQDPHVYEIRLEPPRGPVC